MHRYHAMPGVALDLARVGCEIIARGQNRDPATGWQREFLLVKYEGERYWVYCCQRTVRLYTIRDLARRSCELTFDVQEVMGLIRKIATEARHDP